jgi:hypothetical protein
MKGFRNESQIMKSNPYNILDQFMKGCGHGVLVSSIHILKAKGHDLVVVGTHISYPVIESLN